MHASTHLSAAEAAYIVENCEAQVVVASYELREVAISIRNANPERAIGDPGPLMQGIMSSFGTNAETVYLWPAPLYHAAPICFCRAMHRVGATEGHGGTQISSAEWLSHRGFVGQPVYGSVLILDEQGQELAVGEIGTVCFEAKLPRSGAGKLFKRTIRDRYWQGRDSAII